MSNLNDLIGSIPAIPSQSKSSSGNGLNMILMKSYFQDIAKTLREEIGKIKVDGDTVGLSRDIMNLTRALSNLENSLGEKANSVDRMYPSLEAVTRELKAAVDKLEIKTEVKVPSDLRVSINPVDLEKIRPLPVTPLEFPKEMGVKKIGEIIAALRSLSEAMDGLRFPEEMRVSNLGELKIKDPSLILPKEVLDAILKLNLLGRTPAEALAVRLADGESFYKAVAESVGQAVAFTPSPGDAVRMNGASFTLAMDGTAKRITATSTKIHRLEVTGTAPFFWGYDAAVSHTSPRGCKYLPNGLSQNINVDDLNKVYFIAAEGVTVCGNYLL